MMKLYLVHNVIIHFIFKIMNVFKELWLIVNNMNHKLFVKYVIINTIGMVLYVNSQSLFRIV